MSNAVLVEALTNTTPKSCVDKHCECPTLWSLAQHFCYTRLCNTTEKKHTYRLINDYAARARRIAATYARIYLETEERGDPSKKGRHYWMALGAFASKTVACSLEDPRLYNNISQTVRDGLGQGNFWLFMDIVAWHWHYNFDPDSFAACVDKRDASTYVSAVEEHMKKLPWAAESLAKIDNFKVTAEVREAMGHAGIFVAAISDDRRRAAQLNNLLAWAVHEQRNILQKLIYDNPEFAWRVQVQRGGKGAGTLGRTVGLATSWLAPRLKIAFVNGCDADSPEFEDVAPDDIKLENYDSRILWINKVADHFHGLMAKYPERMDHELRTIAGWVHQPDSVRYQGEAPA